MQIFKTKYRVIFKKNSTSCWKHQAINEKASLGTACINFKITLIGKKGKRTHRWYTNLNAKTNAQRDFVGSCRMYSLKKLKVSKSHISECRTKY